MEAETKEIIKEKEYVHGRPDCWDDTIITVTVIVVVA